MTDIKTGAYPQTVIGSNGNSGVLLVDATALINFDRIGSLDTLLAADRTVVITPEVRIEAVNNGLTSSNPAVFASAQRIASWIELHASLGDVEVKASDPNRAQLTGTGAGENSIRADAAFLGASMATISFNYSGVSSDLRPLVQQAVNKVFTDPTIRSQIGNQADSLTTQFGHASTAVGLKSSICHCAIVLDIGSIL
jgi:hypothetical protein